MFRGAERQGFLADPYNEGLRSLWRRQSLGARGTEVEMNWRIVENLALGTSLTLRIRE